MNLRKNRKKDIIILVSLIIALFVINYPFLDNALKNFIAGYETAIVERVIDGDTVVLEGGDRVRLMGIDAPERGEFYALEATEFLEEKILNKTVIT